MDSNINWDAISAISTFLAVITAFVLPFLVSYFQAKKEKSAITRAIDHELETNYKKLLPLSKNPTITNIGGRDISRQQFMFIALRDSGLAIETWQAFRFKLAVLNHQAFISYNELYAQLYYLDSTVIRVQDDPNSPFASSLINGLPDYVDKFISIYNSRNKT